MSVSPRPWEREPFDASHPLGHANIIIANGGVVAEDVISQDADHLLACVNAMHAAGIERPEGLADLVGICEIILRSNPADMEIAQRLLGEALAACRETDDAQQEEV